MKRACLYSGGLDSSTAHYYLGGDKYTVIWEGYKTKDDYCDNAKILITRKMVKDCVQKVFKCFDKPVIETGIFPLYLAYKYLTERGYEEIVTGNGADEIFLGYKYSKLALIFPNVAAKEIVRFYHHHLYISEQLAKHFKVRMFSPFTDIHSVKEAYEAPLYLKCSLFRDKIALRELMKDKIKVRPKYYWHNPIQKWLGIKERNKADWFLKQWIKSQI